ncbi:unnamed protein product [Leuciscus chuanchicus]
MVWGYIQYGGVREICRVEGNINSLKYQEILATSYIPNHKRGQILQQDGAPSHTSISTSKFLKAKKIKMLQDWPAQSPDMNIIEHMWGRMKEEAWKTKPKNIDELWEACKTAFFAIPDDFINKLYESLPNRMDAVLQAHGSVCSAIKADQFFSAGEAGGLDVSVGAGMFVFARAYKQVLEAAKKSQFDFAFGEEATMSSVWSFFKVSEEDPRYAVCNDCEGRVMRGGVCVKSFNTTNLITHLKNKHPNAYKEYEKLANANKQRKKATTAAAPVGSPIEQALERPRNSTRTTRSKRH